MNIVLLSPFVKEVMQVVLDEKVPVIATEAGNPEAYISVLKKIDSAF
jgi:enoyl-[acyl-carrier protein] reductase II